MSSALINRSLTNVRTELEFLRDSNVISEQVYNNILDQIPIKYDPNQSRTSTNTPLSPPPQAPPTNATGEYVEALYEFQPQQNGDLHIRPGDKIEVLEKLSPEWFKGRCNGNVGMFPSNYVKPAFSNNTSMVKAEPPQYSQPSQPPQQMQYQPPFPPPSTGYYQQPAPQPQQIIIQQEQPQNTGSSQLKKFGSKLGNAAIFGAGATLGSDLVNSIF